DGTYQIDTLLSCPLRSELTVNPRQLQRKRSRQLDVSYNATRERTEDCAEWRQGPLRGDRVGRACKACRFGGQREDGRQLLRRNHDVEDLSANGGKQALQSPRHRCYWHGDSHNGRCCGGGLR